MKMKSSALWLTVLVWIAASPAAEALDRSGWVISAGVFDTARDERPVEVGLEYRFRPVTLWTVPFTVAAGVSATEDENFWVYGAIRYEWEVSEHWVLTPTLGASWYEDGDGKDLGGPVEFRSGIEFAYRSSRDKKPRIGLLFYHLSNANIYGDNPGANSLVLTLALGR